MSLFRGVFTALVTPFRDGRVDETAFAALVERQIAAGVHGLVPVGTTGETATLTHEEHARVVSLCVEVAAKRVPVIAGAGSNATEEARYLVRHAKYAGADAALVVTPYYNRPSQEGLYRHYEALGGQGAPPVLVYNVPSRTGVDISNATLDRLSALPHIVGVKDATGDLARVALQRLSCGPDWTLLSGDDPSGLGYVAHGGHGCISVTANVAPGPCARMYEACLAGDFTAARKINDTLARLHGALFADASPAPTKYALAKLGLISEDVRLPIAPCSEAAREAVDAALAEAGVTS